MDVLGVSPPLEKVGGTVEGEECGYDRGNRGRC